MHSKLCAAVACACALFAALAHAQPVERFPLKPIRLIVPFPPGGSNDILGRFMGQKLGERLSQQTVIDNRAGADGIIGTDANVLASHPSLPAKIIRELRDTETAEPAIASAGEFNKLIARDLAKWQQVAKEAGIKTH